MEEERFAQHPPSRENQNPRPVTSGLILDRFRALAPDNDEVVQVYEDLLAELTVNSKPIITELTIIAGEQREHAEGIANALCERILEVPVDQKLPSLYLLDSIVKNIGREYVRHFAARLPKVFCEAYNQVHSNMHSAMRHLFATWSQVFPSSMLRKIEKELQFSTTESQRPAAQLTVRNSESPSPRPSHSIHVNPKYLEARRQLQHSAAVGVGDTQKIVHTAEFEEEGVDRLASESPKGWSGASPKFHDIEHGSGNSSRLHGYDSNSSVQYGDYDINNQDALLPHVGRSKTGSLQTAPVQTSISVVDGPIRHLNVKVSKCLSPRAGMRRSPSPIDDRLPIDGSSWRSAERASQPHSRLGFPPGRAFDQNGWMERSWLPEVGSPQREHSTMYDPSIGYGKKHPRELIDAYGNDRGKGTSFEKLPKLQRNNVNGINRDAATKNWRSFEEEEYVWEDMSPTLADRNRRNSLPPLGPSSGSLSGRISLNRPDDNILEPDFRGNNWHGQTKPHPVDNPAMILNDRRSVIGSHVSMHLKSFDAKGSQHGQFHHNHSSHHVQDPGKFPYNFQHASGEVNSLSRGRGPEMAVPEGTAANGQKVPSHCDSYADVDVPFHRLPNIHRGSLNVEPSILDNHLELKPFSFPTAPDSRHHIHKSLPQSLPPAPPNHQKQFRSPFLMESSKPVNQGPNPSMFLPHQQCHSADGKNSISSIAHLFPHQQVGILHENQQNQELGDGLRTQLQDTHGGYVPSLPLLSSHLLAQPLDNTRIRGPEFAVGALPNQIPAMHSSGAMHGMPHSSALAHGGILPPLPHVPHPALSHVGPSSQNTGSVMSGSPVSAFSGLISTLMAQGLISLTPPARPEDSVGLEFNLELLKVRHESAINALYANLPRQCTTCGLRFKGQEEHRNHMDWHVTKNRISKNRKQKPSRKWFVNTKEWLSGAETVGTDIIPFLPTEIVTEKKEDKEMAVPADENQTVCALCGEPFEDFYSDEAEEWMYKGAVYLNVPDGNINGLDRSQLGPIVHAKCRSGSNEGS